jgi:hypothetical protein
MQLKPEQRKSIINLLRGEDAGYRDSSYGIQKSSRFQLYIYICKIKLASCYMLFYNSYDASTSSRIFLIVVLIFVEATFILGIAAMKLDDDFKNINISKHAQLLVVQEPFKG